MHARRWKKSWLPGLNDYILRQHQQVIQEAEVVATRAANDRIDAQAEQAMAMRTEAL
jgi:hypothetical protein